MKRLSFTLRLTVLVLGLFFALLLGANYRGVMIPEVRWLSLALLVVMALSWLLTYRGQYATPLDAALPFWLAALALSLWANPDHARRAWIALWYGGVFLGLWYLLMDLLARRRISIRLLVDGLLFTGVFVLIFGYIEAAVYIRSGVGPLAGLRVRSILNNPNLLAFFLVVIILLALGRLLTASTRFQRLALGAYGALALALLIATFSRTAWISALVAVGIGFLLLLYQRGWLSIKGLIAGWQRQSRGFKTAWLSILVLFGIGAMLIVLVIVQSMLDPIRGLAERPRLFASAWTLFTEQPLTGYGLHTYGLYYGRFPAPNLSVILSNAHNLVVNILAELGLAGLLALLLTATLAFRSALTNWHAADGREKTERAIALALLSSLAVWHLIDLPTFFLPITLTLVVTLVIILSPVRPNRVQRSAGRAVRVGGTVILWGVLLVTGFWDARLYSAYVPVYHEALRTEDFRASAEQYQPFIAADPGLVVYRDQQAFLYGLAAHQGDPAARSAAIAGYEAVVELEPYYAPYWANLGALYWADDQQRTGWEKMQRAAELRPADWNFQYSVGLYAEALGDDAAARAAYAQTFEADPDADLHPVWGEMALQREFHSELADRPPLTRVVLLMEAGQIDEALNLWAADPREHRLVQYHVVRSLLALAQNAREEAQRWYDSADKLRPHPNGDLWVTVNAGHLARYDGDRTALATALQAIADYQDYQITTVDYRYGESISVNQFLRPAFPRQLLPPVFYSPEPVLLNYLRQQLLSDAN